MDGIGAIPETGQDPTFGTKSLKWRSIVPPDYGRSNPDPFVKAAAWALPWSIHNYPGYRRGLAAILNEKWTFATIRGWHRRKNTPLWAKERLAVYLEDRLRQGQRALDDLRRDIEATPDKSQRRNSGFTVVRDDGRDRRGNWRK